MELLCLELKMVLQGVIETHSQMFKHDCDAQMLMRSWVQDGVSRDTIHAKNDSSHVSRCVSEVYEMESLGSHDESHIRIICMHIKIQCCFCDACDAYHYFWDFF